MPTIQHHSDPLPGHKASKAAGHSPHARDKRYNSQRWRKLRRQVLARSPICVACLEEGRTTAANTVDHVEPVRLGGAFWDSRNLQALCSPCHNAKSGKEGHTHRGEYGG